MHLLVNSVFYESNQRLAAGKSAPIKGDAGRRRRATAGMVVFALACLAVAGSLSTQPGIPAQRSDPLAEDFVSRWNSLPQDRAPVQAALPARDDFVSRWSSLPRSGARATTDLPLRQSFQSRWLLTQTDFAEVRERLPRDRLVRLAALSDQVGSLPNRISIDIPVAKRAQTELVEFDSAPFPYSGTMPRSNTPFLNVARGERRGHRTGSGRLYWQDETYNDRRVLLHIPKGFDARRPGVIVLFFHGHGAKLARDVRDRQQVPAQISQSGMNAVLVAPQFAVDAADSSAGKFWQPGALRRFMAEAAAHLAELYGDPRAQRTFADMPIVLVAYSGGYVPAALALSSGGLKTRVRGVVLLDGLYGELDRFAGWITANRSGFFVSAYTRYTKRRDAELERMLSARGVPVSTSLEKPLRPGVVALLETDSDITHRDFVTNAWVADPVKDVLSGLREYRVLASAP